MKDNSTGTYIGSTFDARAEKGYAEWANFDVVRGDRVNGFQVRPLMQAAKKSGDSLPLAYRYPEPFLIERRAASF